MASDLYTETVARLKTYELFSDETIHHVARFAQQQAAHPTYQAFFQAVGAPEPRMYRDKAGRGVTYIDIPARQQPQKGTLVVHLPMGNPLDSNQLYQMATIAGVLSQYRLIAFGNPAGKPYNFKQQNLRLWDRLSIALRPTSKRLVAAELSYLERQGVTTMYQVGYSYGALKALVESGELASNAVQGLYVIDPVARPRTPWRLAHDFAQTLRPLDHYVRRTHLETFLEAREEASKGDYTAGLRRGINIAIGMMLARTDFIQTLRHVCRIHPDASVWVAWASQSELGDDVHFKKALQDMHANNSHIHGIRLKDDKHAVANDVHLTAALLYEAFVAKG